jgi:hypothetical protein
LTELDDAMLKHMAYLVFVEKRPFSFKDFLGFEVDGKKYKMEHGTFRNKISELNRNGVVELAYNSHIAFYTLKGHKLSKSAITPDHTEVTNSYNISWRSSSSTSITNHNHKSGNGYLYESIINLPLEHNSIHDIRLKFKANGIWSTLYSHCNKNEHSNPELSMNIHNKDILFHTWKLNNYTLIRVTVHKTDTVSIIIACSLRPISITFDGISKLTELLTRTEERISNMIKNIQKDNDKNNYYDNANTTSVNIPHHNNWIITMWHFGADSRLQCSGEKFSITVKDGRNILLRVYTKQRDLKHTRIRIERQEYPRKSIIDAINEKLDKNLPYG